MTDASSRPGRPWGFTAAAFRENRVNVGCRFSRQLRPLFFVKVFVISRLMSGSAAVLTCRRLGFPGTMTEQQSPPEQMATGEGAGERGGNYKVPWGQLVTDGLGVMLEVTVTLVPVSERCRLYWGNEQPPAVPAQQLENSAPRPPSCRGRGRRLPLGGFAAARQQEMLVGAKYVCPPAWRAAVQRFDLADKAPRHGGDRLRVRAVELPGRFLGHRSYARALVGGESVAGAAMAAALPAAREAGQLLARAHPANGVTRCQELGLLIALGWKGSPEDPSLHTPRHSVSALVLGTRVSAGTPLGQGLGCAWLLSHPPVPRLCRAPAASCSSAPKLCPGAGWSREMVRSLHLAGFRGKRRKMGLGQVRPGRQMGLEEQREGKDRTGPRWGQESTGPGGLSTNPLRLRCCV